MFLAFTWFPGTAGAFISGMLFDLAIKATFILAFTLIVNALLRKSSAALRHAIYSLGLISLLMLPVLSMSLPAWRITLPVAIALNATLVDEVPSPEPITNFEPYPASLKEPVDSVYPPISVSPLATSVDGTIQNSIEVKTSTFMSTAMLITLAWLIGTCIMVLSTAIGLVRVSRFRLASARLIDSNWLQDFRNLTSKSKLLRRVLLLQNATASTPMMCGILRPAIIIPNGYRVDTVEERRRILLHELAHIQRFDVAIHLIGRVACCLYWFHPFAWWCLRKMQQEREFACDDWVLASGSSASDYATQLLSVARHQFASTKSIPGTIGIIHHTNLEQRVRCLLSDSVSHSKLKGLVLLTVMATFTLLSTIVAVADPQSPSTLESPEERSSEAEPADIALDVSKQATGESKSSTRGVSTAVNVTCIAHDGSPVANAEVHLFQGTHGGNDNVEYVHYGPFKSDDEGKVECPQSLFLNKEQSFDRWVYARVPGRLVGVARSVNWANRTLHNTDCVVKLQASNTVYGKVQVPPGFDPATATVRVQVMDVFVGEGEWDYEGFPRYHPFLVKTLPDVFSKQPDSQGRFHFDDIPVRGRLYLIADGKELGQAQWWNRSDRFDDSAELTMKPEGRLTGQVLSPDGKPVKDIEVSARIISNGNRDVAHETTFRAETDEDGKYLLAGLPDWDFMLSATDHKKRWVARPVENIRIISSKTTNQNLVFDAGVGVSGRVIDSEGNPVEGAALSAIVDSQIGSGLSHDTSDSDGRYTLRLPAGPARLYFNALPPEFTYPEPQVVKELDIARGQADLENVDFTVTRKE